MKYQRQSLEYQRQNINIIKYQRQKSGYLKYQRQFLEYQRQFLEYHCIQWVYVAFNSYKSTNNQLKLKIKAVN